MSRHKDHCRTAVGANDRSVHLVTVWKGLTAPACRPALARTNGGFETCRGPATCVACRSAERNRR